jgi:ABC-type multidrug transport system fused ATPase/permease subunit
VSHQEAIRSAFTSATVLMVAHRLETVIDCEKVVVLAAGRVVEQGSPRHLLGLGAGGGGGGTGAFARLVAETGPQTEAKLRAMALSATHRRHR